MKSVRLNHSAMAAMLKSAEVGAAVKSVAERVAANVNDQGKVAHAGYGSMGPEVVATVKSSVTDRQRAAVIVQHPAAAAMEAKYGLLSKAAGNAGVELKR